MKLFAKKDDTETGSDDSSPNTASPRGLSSASLSFFLFLAAALTAVAAGYMAYGSLAAQADKIELQQQVALAESGAAHIGGRLAVLHESLGMLTQEPQLIAALRKGDRNALQRLLERFRDRFHGALSLRVLDPRWRDPNPEMSPALGYACLEQSSRAANASKPVDAEVHLFGTEDQHIDLIQAIRDGDDILGSLQLTLEVGLLKEWLRGLVPAGAQMELRQNVGNASVLLAAQGNAALQGREPLHDSRIAGSSWTLSFRNDYKGLLPEAERFYFVAIFGGQIAILGLIAIGFAILLGRLLHADLVKLVKYFIGVMNNERMHSFALRLSEFQKATSALDGYVHKHPPQPQKLHLGAQPAPESGIQLEEPEEPEEPLEAELPDVMFMDSSAISLEESDNGADKDNGGDKK